MRLGRRAWRLVLVPLAYVAGGGMVAAQPAPFLTAYFVAPVGQTLLPDTAPLNRSEQTFSEGDVVLRGRIAYRAAAVVTEPVDLDIAGQHFRVEPSMNLNEARIRGGVMTDLRGARAFCLPELKPEDSENGRFDEHVQLCLVDRDSDGRLDFAILAGTRRPGDRAPVRLASFPYRVQPDLPIEGAELRLTFKTHLSLTPPSLQLGILLPFSHSGVQIRIAGSDGRMHDMRLDDNVTSRTYPHVVSFGPARFEILEYDPVARQVRLRILEGFTRSDLEIVRLIYGRR